MLRFAGAKRPRRPLELADMGTAFGLDQSLDAPGAGGPGEPPVTARVVTPVAPWRLWLGRKLGG
jgi:hypothetical protein